MWLELSEFNIKIFLPLVFPIVKRIEDIPRKAYLTNDNQLFKTFRYFFCYILSFIPFLIIKIRTKKSDKIEEEKIPQVAIGNITNEINELYKKNKRKHLIKDIIFLVVICIMGLFCYLYRYLFEKKDYEFTKQSVGIFFIIFNYIILSFFILKKKLYKHNYVTSAIIAFILIILFIITTFYIKSEAIFPSILYYFGYAFCFGLYGILGKRYMNNFFHTPHYLMFVLGLMGTFALIIFDLFVYFLYPENDEIFIGFQKNVNDISKVFIFISNIILQWMWNVGIWFTIYYLSPCHYFISEYISEYAYYLVNANKSNDDFYKTTNIVIFSIAFFINLFLCLVFNEVIILNFLGLDYNTNKRILEREYTDFVDTFTIELIDQDKNKEEETENDSKG